MTDTDRIRADKDSTPEWWKKLRKNPALILGIAGLFGVSGEQVQGVLEADVPGWVAAIIAGALPIAYVCVRWARSHLDAQREMTEAVKLLREDVHEVKVALADGREKFAAHSELLNQHEGRVALIENVFRAEIAAYLEKTKRETGKVKPVRHSPKGGGE